LYIYPYYVTNAVVFVLLFLFFFLLFFCYIFSGVRAAQSLVVCVVFCRVWPSVLFISIYGLWLPLLYLQAFSSVTENVYSPKNRFLSPLIHHAIVRHKFTWMLEVDLPHIRNKGEGQKVKLYKTLHRQLRIEQHEPH
jgi:hypothetical protein